MKQTKRHTASIPRMAGVLGTAVIILFSVGCAETSMQANYLPDAGSQAAEIYNDNCGRCHVPPHPKRHTFAAWQDIISLMDRRIRERNMPAIGEEERKTILSYLKKHGR